MVRSNKQFNRENCSSNEVSLHNLQKNDKSVKGVINTLIGKSKGEKVRKSCQVSVKITPEKLQQLEIINRVLEVTTASVVRSLIDGYIEENKRFLKDTPSM